MKIRTSTAAVLAAALLLAVSGTGCITWPHGIEPVQPKHGQHVDENPLVLEWLPAKDSASTLTRYQLAIFDSNSQNVYEVKNLVATSHNVPNNLGPGFFKWQVRPLHYRDGKWVPGAWNKRKYFYFAGVLFGWGSHPYGFNIKPQAAQ